MVWCFANTTTQAQKRGKNEQGNKRWSLHHNDKQTCVSFIEIVTTVVLEKRLWMPHQCSCVREMMAGGLYYDYIHLSSYKGQRGDLGQRVLHLRVKHPAYNKSNSIRLGKQALGFHLSPLPWYLMAWIWSAGPVSWHWLSQAPGRWVEAFDTY